MRATMRRLLALLLTLSMCLSPLNATAWATDIIMNNPGDALALGDEPADDPGDVPTLGDESGDGPNTGTTEPDVEADPEEVGFGEGEILVEDPAPKGALETQSNTIDYLEASADSTTHAVTFTTKTHECTEVTSSTTSWGANNTETWYVVKAPIADDLTIADRITVSGTVNLILCDGAKLTASKGITVNSGKTLNIYAQSDGENKGTLYATGYGGDSNSAAGIGGTPRATSGTVNIHGGTVIANGGSYSSTYGGYGGAGIGGGYNAAGGTVNIYGGSVTAKGGRCGAGIGAGGYINSNSKGKAGGTVNIYGGTVTATGQYYAAGIGGSFGGFPASGYMAGGTGGPVAIYGGKVTASGSVGIGAASGNSNHNTLVLGDGMYLYKSSVTPANAVKPSDGGYARAGTMIIEDTPPHTHNYSYDATGAVITMTCSGTRPDFCNLPLVDNVPTASITIKAPAEGGEASVEVEPSDIFDAEKISAIRYQTKGAGGDWEDESSAPVSDGFHKASVTYTTPEEVELTAFVVYGLNCATYVNTEGARGTVSGPAHLVVGETITPTLTPDTGYEVDTLTVVETDTQNPVPVANNESFVMPEANVTISATFSPIDYHVTIADSIENGGVSASRGEDAVTADTNLHYEDTITLALSPDLGYELDVLSVQDSDGGDVDVTGTGDTRTFSMPASDVTVSATFAPIDYDVTVTQPGAGGTIGADKATANVGNEVTLTATPAEGYELNSFEVTKDGGGTVAVTDGKFTMPASDVTVSATFAPIDYYVTIDDGIENGTVTTSTTGAVHIGDEVTLTVTPAEGYGLESIATTSGTLAQTALDGESGVATYVLTMAAADATVTAEFAKSTIYTVFYSASASPDAVRIRFPGSSGDGYAMTSSAKLGNIDCWSIQVPGGAGIESLSFAIKEGDGEWAILNIPVNSDIPDALPAGSAVAIEGEVKAFVMDFVWGEDAEADGRYYLVTSNTDSIDVPNPANTADASFTGWTYLVPSAQEGEDAEEVTVSRSEGTSTTVPLDKISQTTIVSAVWRPNSRTVSFDPNNGGAVTTQSVDYGQKVAPLAAPAKEGYEFVGWVLADNAVEKVGNKTVQFSPGAAFDFGAEIINDLSLQAKWRHVHAYVCLQLDDPVFGGTFADYYGYKGQLHIRLCTSWDDYSVEAHSFVNGRCACGASILDDRVTLTEYVGGTTSQSSVVRNSVVSVIAPQKQGAQTFSKWQYSADATDGQSGTWYDLSTMRGVAFAIPASLSTRAVYEQDRFKLTMDSFKYGDSYVAFQFNYSVPDGFTVVDGGLMIGDNVGMRFWDCAVNLFFLGHTRTPSLRNAVKVFGGGTVASKMFKYETINEPGVARPILKPLRTFGKTGTVALAYQPYTSEGYMKALGIHVKDKDYDQAKYPTYAMGYIVCRDDASGGYAIFSTRAISATLASPNHSDVTQIPVS